MIFISWNVNGLRAVLNKGFMNFFNSINADIFALQETKMIKGQVEINLANYEEFWNSAEKKGYSGTAVFSKISPLSIKYGIDIEEHDREGRVITLEYDDFYFINVYTPNSKEKLARLDYRMIWEDDFKNYLLKLDKVKPIILCGDLNIAHNEIDLKNPKTNRKNAGFSNEERNKFSKLLASGFSDVFRKLNPDKTSAYTWWSYKFNARANNTGWRIDYFLVSDRIFNKVINFTIHDDIYGSDHCPVSLEINL